MIDKILDEIWRFSEEERIPFIERVLQTQFGGYGYGDQIAGVRVPILREIARKYNNLSLENVEILLQDDLHEARFVALVLLNKLFKKQPVEVFEIYLNNTKIINNWDLVDISAPHIVGPFCLKFSNTDPIWNLAKSDNLWENRIAIVSSWAFIKAGNYDMTLNLCKHFINHKHHLIHKACGWLLREVGKKDETLLIDFLKTHKDKLPRITISYAQERLKRNIYTHFSSRRSRLIVPTTIKTTKTIIIS